MKPTLHDLMERGDKATRALRQTIERSRRIRDTIGNGTPREIDASLWERIAQRKLRQPLP